MIYLLCYLPNVKRNINNPCGTHKSKNSERIESWNDFISFFHDNALLSDWWTKQLKQLNTRIRKYKVLEFKKMKEINIYFLGFRFINKQWTLKKFWLCSWFKTVIYIAQIVKLVTETFNIEKLPLHENNGNINR